MAAGLDGNNGKQKGLPLVTAVAEFNGNRRAVSGGFKPHVDELEKLAGEIGWYEDQARKTVLLVLQYKLEIGRRLARAKALLPHGAFLSWAQSHFGWSPRHIQRHLTLAENASRVSRLPPGASLRMALAAIQENPADGQQPPRAKLSRGPQRIHIVGDLEQGNIDRDRLLSGIVRLAAELGAERIRWRIR